MQLQNLMADDEVTLYKEHERHVQYGEHRVVEAEMYFDAINEEEVFFDAQLCCDNEQCHSQFVCHPQMMCHIETLPDDLLAKVFQKFTWREMISVSRVCWKWRLFCRDLTEVGL